MDLADIREMLRNGERPPTPAEPSSQPGTAARRIRGTAITQIIIDDPMGIDYGAPDETVVFTATIATPSSPAPDDALAAFFGPDLKGRAGLMPRRDLTK